MIIDLLKKIFKYCDEKDQLNLLCLSKSLIDIVKEAFYWNRVLLCFTCDLQNRNSKIKFISI